MRLVAGYSGVGKTSLVEEMRSSVLCRRGLFASGTFEADSNAMPYGGILTALQGLVVQKLGGAPEQAQEAWGRRLVAELGTNLGLMTEALPELLSLVGEPPPVAEVPPENARNRFHGCVGRFLATLTDGSSEGNGPVVLFLDDLQWVDAASLELLESLLTGDARAFLLLGAYRDNEVDEDHPLPRTVAGLALRGVDVDTLRLQPLSETALSQWVADSLRLPLAEAAPLAELVYRKTTGNPFFARTFLSTLDQRGLLRFIAGQGRATAAGQGRATAAGEETSARWTWDLEAISSLEATESVVELVAVRFGELSATARRIVAVASMLGKEVDAEPWPRSVTWAYRTRPKNS